MNVSTPQAQVCFERAETLCLISIVPDRIKIHSAGRHVLYCQMKHHATIVLFSLRQLETYCDTKWQPDGRTRSHSPMTPILSSQASLSLANEQCDGQSTSAGTCRPGVSHGPPLLTGRKLTRCVVAGSERHLVKASRSNPTEDEPESESCLDLGAWRQPCCRAPTSPTAHISAQDRAAQQSIDVKFNHGMCHPLLRSCIKAHQCSPSFYLPSTHCTQTKEAVCCRFLSRLELTFMKHVWFLGGIGSCCS